MGESIGDPRCSAAFQLLYPREKKGGGEAAFRGGLLRHEKKKERNASKKGKEGGWEIPAIEKDRLSP